MFVMLSEQAHMALCLIQQRNRAAQVTAGELGALQLCTGYKALVIILLEE